MFASDDAAVLGLPIAMLSSIAGMVSAGLPVTVIVTVTPDIVELVQPRAEVALVTEYVVETVGVTETVTLPEPDTVVFEVEAPSQ